MLLEESYAAPRRAKLEGGAAAPSAEWDRLLKAVATGNEAEYAPFVLEVLRGNMPRTEHVEEALMAVVESSHAVAAEMAIRCLGNAKSVARLVRAVSRPQCQASVLQQALRTLTPVAEGEHAEALIRLALDAVRDRRAATRAECLRTLSQLCDERQCAAAHLEQGMADFAADDEDARVRSAAINGLVELHKRKYSQLSLAAMWEVGLLGLEDDADRVRTSAVRLIHLLGCTYPHEEAPSPRQWRVVDRVFVLLCVAVMDPSLQVRTTAAGLVGALPVAPSDHVLMQALSKKPLFQKPAEYGGGGGGGDYVLATLDDDKSPVQAQWGSLALQDQQAIGAFVHALEEEFAEVRLAALESICELSLKSKAFASDALEYVADMLHDESSDVRLKTIHCLRRMGAVCARLQSEHLVMLLFLLSESAPHIRRAVQMLLQEVIHPDTTAFRNTVLCLCNNLARYPQDWEDVLEALVGLGKGHPVLCELLVEQLLGLDHPGFLVQERTVSDRRYVATLMLLTSAASGNPRISALMPPLALKHAEYLRNKYAWLFDAASDAEVVSPQFCAALDRDVVHAVAMRQRGCSAGDARALLQRRLAAGAADGFASVWVAAVAAHVSGAQSEVVRLSHKLELGFAQLPEELQKHFLDMRRLGSAWSPLPNVMTLAAGVRPIVGEVLAVPLFPGTEYLGALPYPVTLQGFVNVDLPTHLAVLCIFPDRAWSLVPLVDGDFTCVRPHHWTILKKASFTVRQAAWTEACAVTLVLVRRFFGDGVVIGVEPEPRPQPEESLGGVLAIASTTITLRPRK